MLNGEEERRSKRSPSFDRRISLTINSDLTNENDKHSRTSERDMLESPELFCGKLGIKLLRIFEILLISCFMDNSRSNKFDSRPTARKGTADGNCDASIDDANSSTDDNGRSVNLHMNNLCHDSGINGGLNPLSVFSLLLFSFSPSASNIQILTFHGIIIKLVTKNVLPSVFFPDLPSSCWLSVFNTSSAAVALILRQATLGTFTTAVIELGLQASLTLLRAVSGGSKRAAQALGAEGQRSLVASAVFMAQHLACIALTRCAAKGTVVPSV